MFVTDVWCFARVQLACEQLVWNDVAFERAVMFVLREWGSVESLAGSLRS